MCLEDNVRLYNKISNIPTIFFLQFVCLVDQTFVVFKIPILILRISENYFDHQSLRNDKSAKISVVSYEITCTWQEEKIEHDRDIFWPERSHLCLQISHHSTRNQIHPRI